MTGSNTFEVQQQRNYLIQLLSRASSIYEPAAAAGLSPAAFRLVCWKVQQKLTTCDFNSSTNVSLCWL